MSVCVCVCVLIIIVIFIRISSCTHQEFRYDLSICV